MSAQKLSFKITDPQNTISKKTENVRIKFKHTCEISRSIKGLTLEKAIFYLNNVLKRKDCIKVTKFAKKCGRTKQANSHKIVNNKRYSDQRGRWPIKPTKAVLAILSGLVQEAEQKNIHPGNVVIVHVNVNRAPQIYGRIQKAFGSVAPYNSKPCHVEIVGMRKSILMDGVE